jgi:hypothetical protein
MFRWSRLSLNFPSGTGARRSTGIFLVYTFRGFDGCNDDDWNSANQPRKEKVLEDGQDMADHKVHVAIVPCA